MLTPPATFPYPGSYALLVDQDAPYPQADELVRINWRREGWAMVSFPLRDGASGNKTVAAADLVDATPLTAEEAREFHDLDRSLFGRIDGAVGLDGRRTRLTAKQKRARARRDALRARLLAAPIMARLMLQMREKQASQQEAA